MRLTRVVLFLAAVGACKSGGDGHTAATPTTATTATTPTPATPTTATPAPATTATPTPPTPPATTATTALAAEAFPADCSTTPISQAQHDILWATPADQPPPFLDGVRPDRYGQHYYVSDERHAELFQPAIANLGGGYVGVGSDQAYLYIGWARPQFAWTIDYDNEVVDMHWIQQAFFEEAATPQAFQDLWSRKHDKDARAALTKHYGDRADLKHLLDILELAQGRMARRFTRLHELDKTKVPTYLNDQPTYDFIRGLIKNGCVRPMLANLLATDGLKGIGAAAKQVGLPIRAVYFSNAEQYWDYTDQFRDNIRGLPSDEKSLALHTLAGHETYHFYAQPLVNFVAWLDEPTTKRVYSILGTDNSDGFDTFAMSPADAKAARDAARHHGGHHHHHDDDAPAPTPTPATP